MAGKARAPLAEKHQLHPGSGWNSGESKRKEGINGPPTPSAGGRVLGKVREVQLLHELQEQNLQWSMREVFPVQEMP